MLGGRPGRVCLSVSLSSFIAYSFFRWSALQEARGKRCSLSTVKEMPPPLPLNLSENYSKTQGKEGYFSLPSLAKRSSGRQQSSAGLEIHLGIWDQSPSSNKGQVFSSLSSVCIGF